LGLRAPNHEQPPSGQPSSGALFLHSGVRHTLTEAPGNYHGNYQHLPNLRTSGNIRDSLPFLGNGRPSAVRTEYPGFTGTSVGYLEYRVLRGKSVRKSFPCKFGCNRISLQGRNFPFRVVRQEKAHQPPLTYNLFL
jgi:hypothetical protein